MSGTEKLKFDHAQILYFRLKAEKMFCMKILLILLKFHEETLSRSGDMKTFPPGKRMYMYTLPPLKEEVLNKERQLMKWVGILQVEIFQGGNIPGRSLLGGNLPGGNFPGGNFPRTV